MLSANRIAKKMTARPSVMTIPTLSLAQVTCLCESNIGLSSACKRRLENILYELIQPGVPGAFQSLKVAVKLNPSVFKIHEPFSDLDGIRHIVGHDNEPSPFCRLAG